MSRLAKLRLLLYRHWPIVLPALLTVAVFHAWVQPGLILGADWVRRVPGELNTFFPWPPAWNGAQQLGETNEVYLFEFPLLAMMGLLSRLHLSWNVIERVLFLWPYLTLSVICPYALAFRFTRSSYASAIAAAICTINTWVIMATERGAIPSIIAASLIPVFILQAIAFIERATIRRAIALSLTLTLLLIYDLRYVYISLFFAFVLAAEQLLRDRSFARVRRALPALGIAVVTTLITNLFWILPQFFEPANNGTDYGTLADYIYNSHFMTPQHALSDFAVFYHWVASNNPFAPADPDWWFFALPAGVFASLFFVWKRKWVWSLTIGAFVAILLDSGPSFPVDKINIWIFTHLPGMSLFRDVTKWMSLLELTYAVLIAMGLARLFAWIRLRWSRRAAPAIALVPIVLAGCYTLMMYDAFNIMRFRVFATYHVPQDVLAVERFIQSRPNHDRTLVLPRDTEPMRAVLAHPYIEAMQIENSAPNDGFRHFNVHMGDLYSFFATPYGPDLLRLMNVRYIIVPYDYHKIVYSPQIAATGMYDVVDFLRSRPWAHLLGKFGRQYVFEVRDPLEARAFVAPAPFILNGSAAGLAALDGTPLVNPRLGAIIPDQPLPRIASRIPNYVAAGWPVDTLANGVAQAQRHVSRAEALDRAARRGAFSYVADAVDTATTSSTLFWDDRPILMDDSLYWPFNGDASFSANLLDLRTLDEPLLQKRRLNAPLEDIRIKGRDLDFLFNTQVSVQQAGVLRYDASAHVYRGTVSIDNLNPVGMSGQLPLTGLSTSLGKRAGIVRIGTKKAAFQCESGSCMIPDVRLAPGINTLHMSVAVAAPSPHKVTYGLNDNADLQKATIDDAAYTFPVRWLARGIDIPLTKTPRLVFDWQGPEGPAGTRYLVYLMRSREDGHVMTVFDHVNAHPPYATTVLAQWFELVLEDNFARLLAAHASDAGWLFANRLSKEPDGYGAYDLVGIGMSESANGAKSDFPSWKPLSLALYDVPEEYEIAGLDAARPRRATYPGDLTVAARGYVVQSKAPIQGVREWSFTRAGRTASTVVVSSRITGATSPLLDFDLYQGYREALKIVIFNAAGRPLFTVALDPTQHRADFGSGSIVGDDDNDIAWPINTPHCVPTGCPKEPAPLQRGSWRHVSIDVSHLLPNWEDEYAISFSLTPLTKKDRELSFGIATAQTQSTLARKVVPALTVDNHPLSFTSSAKVPESLYTAVRGTAALRSGNHRVVSYPTYPIRPVSIVLQHGHPVTFKRADLTDAQQLVGTEYAGTIDSQGGLLVFSEAYDSRWQMAVVPEDFHPTGFSLLDYLRAKPHLLPPADHYRVDDTLNGWWIPRGKLHVFMIMALDPVLEFSAMAWIAASVLWIGGVLLATRRAAA